MVGNRILVGATALLLAAGCASSDDTPAASSSPSSSAAQPTAAPDAGNGWAFASRWDDDVTITGYPIGADGSVGDGVTVLTGPADDTTYPGVVDGIGQAILTGTFEDFWTRDLAVRSAATGEAVSELDVPQWCGGEGLGYNICVLLDDVRVARTSDLGGEQSVEGTLTISSLQDGSTLDEFGPYPGLTMVLGTSDADTLLLVTVDSPGDPESNSPGDVLALDLTSGTTTAIGEAPADWAPLCAIGTDSVLGFTFGTPPRAVAVGPAQVGEVEWSEDEDPIGCSADGRFLYVQHFPQPPGEEMEDTEPPNPPTTLDRITLADGTREAVLTLDPLVGAGPITR